MLRGKARIAMSVAELNSPCLEECCSFRKMMLHAGTRIKHKFQFRQRLKQFELRSPSYQNLSIRAGLSFSYLLFILPGEDICQALNAIHVIAEVCFEFGMWLPDK